MSQSAGALLLAFVTRVSRKRDIPSQTEASMISNEKGTEHAKVALNGYLQLQGAAGERQFAIIDLITDLFHLAEDEGLDPQKIAGTAELHYRSEKVQMHLTV
jgi:hypothetical protein